MSIRHLLIVSATLAMGLLSITTAHTSRRERKLTMKKPLSLLLHSLAGSVLAAIVITAQAAPTLYTISFDASDTAAGAIGPSGTGSFLYDSVTNPATMTNLTWDFESTFDSIVGGISDADLAPIVGGDLGAFLFNNVFFNTANPQQNGVASRTSALNGWEMDFCWGLLSENCGMQNGTSGGSYRLGGTRSIQTQPWSVGYLTVTQSPVPEPGVPALLGVGLASIGLARRRARGLRDSS